MRCKDVLLKIDALRTGEVSPGEGKKIRAHAHGCQSCDESISDLDRFASAAHRLASELPRRAPKAEPLELADSYGRLEAGGLKVYVAFTNRGIRMIGRGPSAEVRRAYASRFGRELREKPVPERLARLVSAAIEGRGSGKAPVDLSSLTPFEQGVLAVLARIPRGEVRTYSWLARLAGRPKAGRAVGNIMARNPVPFLLPCHRVVPTGGGVGNYGFGSDWKRRLLEREGCAPKELDRLAERHIRYFASKTTGIFCVPTCRDARRIAEGNRVELHDETEARRKGFRPCKHCQPAAA